MTKKNITPEAALTKTYNGIVNVLDCIEKFREDLGDAKTFGRSRFEAFRNKGMTTEEVSYWGGYTHTLHHYEDVSFSTLRNYDVLNVVDIKYEERCVNTGWENETMYRVNDKDFITEREYETLKRIIPNCDEMMKIEGGFYGKSVEAKIYTYSFNYPRIRELYNMAGALSEWVIEE